MRFWLSKNYMCDAHKIDIHFRFGFVKLCAFHFGWQANTFERYGAGCACVSDKSGKTTIKLNAMCVSFGSGGGGGGGVEWRCSEARERKMRHTHNILSMKLIGILTGTDNCRWASAQRTASHALYHLHSQVAFIFSGMNKKKHRTYALHAEHTQQQIYVEKNMLYFGVSGSF